MKYYAQKHTEFGTLHQNKIQQQKQCSIFQVSYSVTSKIGKGLRSTLDHSLEVHSTVWWNLVYMEPGHNRNRKLLRSQGSEVLRIQTSSTYMKWNHPAKEDTFSHLQFQY